MLRILPQSPGNELVELFVNMRFFLIRPAPEKKGVAMYLLFHHIIPLALVFELTGMFPSKLSRRFLSGELEVLECFLIQPGKDLSPGFFPGLVFPVLQHGISPPEGKQ